MLLISVGKYAAFRFGIHGGELAVNSGVLRRRRRSIPVARIQNVSVRQSALQRMFGVAEVQIETAGGAMAEADLSVLSAGRAREVAATLLELRRRALAPLPVGDAPGEYAPAEIARNVEASGAEDLPAYRESASAVLTRLSAGDLALAGATANEAGLLAAALAGALQFAGDLPFLDRWLEPGRVLAALEAIGVGLGDWLAGAVALAVLVLVIVVAGWVVSVVGAVVGYHGFVLEAEGESLRASYGLLTRREVVIPRARIQAVRVEESWIRRAVGLSALRIATAAGRPGEGRRKEVELLVPLVRRDRLAALLAGIGSGSELPGREGEAPAAGTPARTPGPDGQSGPLPVLRPVHPRARRRALVRYGLVLAVLAGALRVLAGPDGLWVLIAAPGVWFLATAHYRSLGYRLDARQVTARAGVFTRITWLIPIAKVQVLHLLETPMQRRHGLATVVVDTAAASRREARVIDLGREESIRLLERVLERR